MNSKLKILIENKMQRKEYNIKNENENKINFGSIIKRKLKEKYFRSDNFYHSKITSDIMYNEPHHLVSVFKDYLIFDDFSEYIKKFYYLKDS